MSASEISRMSQMKLEAAPGGGGRGRQFGQLQDAPIGNG
ncbi:hypothetical protein CSE45_2385 [Citreicella sp. SE45]|nr:hypothetical protein CSE45_2385 [Citreicella sp. SE45]